MEFQETLTPTTPRGLSCNAASPAFFTSPIQLAAVEPTQSPADCKTSPSIEPQGPSEGCSSDDQLYLDLHHRRTRKRRRLNAISSSHANNEEISVEPLSLCKNEHAIHHNVSPPWSASIVSHSVGDSSGLSLASRMAHNIGSIICPCCGFGWEQADGYHRIHESAVSLEPETLIKTEPEPYSSSMPYTTETQPQTWMTVPELYGSGPLCSGQQVPLYNGQSHTEQSPRSILSVDGHVSLATPSRSSASFVDAPGFQYHSETDNELEYRITGSRAMAESQHMTNLGSYSAFYTPNNLNTFTPGLTSSMYGNGQAYGLGSGYGIGLLSPYHASNSQLATAISATGQFITLPEQPTNFDILLPNQRGGKRGPFKDPTLREQTAQTRKIGSCIRCRMQRIRCEHNVDEPNGPCLTCKKVANTRAGQFPCLRYKITDVRLYKPGQVPGYEWTRRWSNSVSDQIQKWASSDIKVVHVTEGYSNHVLKLRVQEFVPQDGDKLERHWHHDGVDKSVAIPPFALVDLEDGKAAYMKHIHNSMNQTFSKILGRPGSLLYRTYHQTLQQCKDPSTPLEALELLRDTFRLWMSVRFSTTSYFIVGDEALGMSNDILDEMNPDSGKIPLPPVLGAQLDLILIHHIQNQLRRQVLERLEKLVSKRKHSTWIVTYLVIFVLLHNTALITAHDARYAQKHGMKRRFAREDKVKEYHLGANILLAHFHYCNKGVYPFSEQCKDQDLRTLAGLDEAQVQFIQTTRRFVKQHKQEWEDLRNRGEVENDYFFVSQLFEENWQPCQPI